MRDLWHLFRGGIPRLEGLSYAFEKGGLILENQPIPWCADSILVAAAVETLPQLPRSKGDFELRVGTEIYLPETQRAQELDDMARIHFRFPVPAQTACAELLWRGRSLGQIALPTLSAEEFAREVTFEMPTVSVRIGDETVACQTYVATQCGGLIASGILQSSLRLLPALELGLRMVLLREGEAPAANLPVLLNSTQLKAHKALVSVVPPKDKRLGIWHLTWYLGNSLLASQTFKAISQKQFHRSLRIASTRFVLQKKNGSLKIERFLRDCKGFVRVGPCFLLASSEVGMAGRCSLHVRAHLKTGGEPLVLNEQEVLITDGPYPFVPGTFEVRELEKIKHFELCCGRRVLGTLPLAAVPTAGFTREGGFVAPDTFEWSGSAEEQLLDRLGKLL